MTYRSMNPESIKFWTSEDPAIGRRILDIILKELATDKCPEKSHYSGWEGGQGKR